MIWNALGAAKCHSRYPARRAERSSSLVVSAAIQGSPHFQWHALPLGLALTEWALMPWWAKTLICQPYAGGKTVGKPSFQKKKSTRDTSLIASTSMRSPTLSLPSLELTTWELPKDMRLPNCHQPNHPTFSLLKCNNFLDFTVSHWWDVSDGYEYFKSVNCNQLVLSCYVLLILVTLWSCFYLFPLLSSSFSWLIWFRLFYLFIFDFIV